MPDTGMEVKNRHRSTHQDTTDSARKIEANETRTFKAAPRRGGMPEMRGEELRVEACLRALCTPGMAGTMIRAG